MQMNGRTMMMYVAVMTLGSALLWGCPKKADVTAGAGTQQEQVSPPIAAAAEAPATAATPTATVKEAAPAAEKTEQGLKAVYFDFDKAFIRDDAKTVLQANAAWLKANPKEKIRIEGNCDERGTVEYNQALGQRRALSAKKYLRDLGISGKRVSVISYGKEKPVCSEHDEACWQKNRRDDFVAKTRK